MLASLDHPGIVRVHRSFEALGTAYFVMPYVEVVAFDTLIEQHKTDQEVFSEAGLRGLLTRMLSALGYLHDRGIYHRDIKPGNILVTNDGVPVLIDFGSARQRLSDRSMTVVESAGYTPFEQLQSRGEIGPWSDLYALGGTLVKALTFESMPKAADRVFDDPFTPLAGRAELMTSYGDALLVSVDKALAVLPRYRHRDAGEWLAALQAPMPTVVVVAKTVSVRASRQEAAERIAQESAERDEAIKRSLEVFVREKVRMEEDARPQHTETPEGFSLIPAGEFQMGDSLGRLLDPPARTVHASVFYMAKHEVTKALWDVVREWGIKYGYADLPIGKGKAIDHPVHSIDWYSMVKWCNAMSEKERLTPCYSVEGMIYRTGTIDAVACNWRASGYRLPTEAEWEKAARGGLSGERFPWGNTITHNQANYTSSRSEKFDVSSTTGYHPNLAIRDKPYTSSVGTFLANGYDLYDMVGNVWEWCWDWDGGLPATSQCDLRGATWGSYRMARGGSWRSGALCCRTAARDFCNPSIASDGFGFRLARSAVR